MTLIHRYKGCPVGKASLDEFRDGNEVSEYACDSFRWAMDEGIIIGDNTKALRPAGELTRGEMAAIIHRMLE